MVKNAVSNSYKKPVISVVIASYNQEKTIKACLESLVNQKTNLNYEIIVVDSSNNKAAEIAKSFSSKIMLIRRNKRTSWGKGRNLGISKSRGEIIAFTDTDCVVDEYWIEAIYKAHKKYDAVGGRVLNGNPRNIFGWTMFFSEFVEFIGRKNKVMPSVVGCNAAYKKWIFEKYGNLPETQWFGAVDDFIFNYSIKEKIFFSSAVQVKHINRTNFLKIIEHSYEFGYWEAVARKKVNLPGRFILQHPVLIPLLPFYRILKITCFALISPYFVFFVFTCPLVFITLVAWTIGFHRGAKNST